MVNLRFVNVVWGRDYTRTYLDVCLPTELAPGNLPYIAARSKSTYRLYTTVEDARAIQASPNFRRLGALMKVELIPVDARMPEDVPGSGTACPEKYQAMSLCHSNFIAAHGDGTAAMIFLSPDLFWGDGSLGHAFDAAQSGCRLLLMCALRLHKESFIAQVAARTPVLSKRELVRQALDHLHPETKSLVWDSGQSSTWPSLLLWQKPAVGLVVRAFHLHPLLVRPTVGGATPKVSIDADYIESVWPDSAAVRVVTDSDDIVGFELSRGSSRSGLIRVEPYRSSTVREWSKANASPRHHSFLQHSIVLHCAESDALQDAIEAADRTVREITAPPPPSPSPLPSESRPDRAVPRCHDCGSTAMKVEDSYRALRRVSSDCQSQPAGGRLARCTTCGLVQAVADDAWEKEARQIYERYAIYHQSGGNEQPVFDPRSGERKSRSDLILNHVLASGAMPLRGRLLDIGCGNGAFLRACSQKLQGWSLCGSEFDARHRETVERIPGVEALHVGPLDAIPGTFEAISLIHVLEHIAAPGEFLRQVARKLGRGGILVIEVPDCSQNPYMLLVADHASHFSPHTLASVVARAGFQVLSVSSGRVPKEITLIARPAALESESSSTFGQAEFLATVAREAGELAEEPAFGIFGTSIGATWLHAQVEGRTGFFVDEDIDRIGRTHEDRPIVAVADVPADACVYLALAPTIASNLAARLQSRRPDVRWIVPRTLAALPAVT